MGIQEISNLFRAYDIRGRVDKWLTPDLVYKIGLSLGAELIHRNQKHILLGQDCRLSSAKLAKAVSHGLSEAGCHVFPIGKIPSPVLYFATHHTSIHSGVMITGSHNPPEDNGLKIVLEQQTLTEEEISCLKNQVLDHYGFKGIWEGCKNNCWADIIKKFKIGTQTFLKSKKFQARTDQPFPKLQPINYLSIRLAYEEAIQKKIHLKKKLKIVIDCGHAAASHIAPTLFRKLGCEVIPLYCDFDGRFPAHHPDPSVPENLQDLIKAVKAHQADIGLAFDGDADRLGVVSNQGNIIWPDQCLILFAQNILPHYPHAPIVFDVKCSKHLPVAISKAGGKPVLYKTGHSLIKAKMKKLQAPLAGEMSGHIFFNDRWFGFDDGLYAGARLLELISQSNHANHLFESLPKSFHTPEIKLPVPDNKKSDHIKQLHDHAKQLFPHIPCLTLDGLRLEFPYGWGLIRASNTTACLTLRLESETPKGLAEIKKHLAQLLSRQGLKFPSNSNCHN